MVLSDGFTRLARGLGPGQKYCILHCILLTDVDVPRSAVSCYLAGCSHLLISDVVGVLNALQPTSGGVERIFSLLSGAQTKYQGRMKDEKFKTTVSVPHPYKAGS